MKKLIACLFGLFITLPAMAVLPQAAINAGYTEVEYIESTGTQYIDTGVVATNAGKPWSWQIKINMSEPAQYMGSNGNIMLMYNSTKGYAAPGGDVYVPYSLNTDLIADVQLTADNKRVDVINGVTSTGSAPSVFSNPIYLMAFSGSSTNSLFLQKGKLYYSKIYSNGTLVQDLVPVKKTVNGTDVYGMYNVLDSNPETAFYGNKGTGSFTGGDPVAQTNCNLFDRSTVTNGHYIAADGSIDDNETSMYSDYIQVKPSTTYTISLVVGYQGNAVRVHDYSANKTWISQKNDVITGAVGSNYTATFTTSSNARYIRFGCRQAHTNIKIEEGSTATPYTPYDASCGGGSTCNNLLNTSSATLGSLLSASGTLNSNANYYTTDYVDLNFTGNFIVSFTKSEAQSATTGNIICFYNSGKTSLGCFGNVSGYADGSISNWTYTGTVPNDAKYYRYSYRKTDINMKLELGDTATPYCTYRGPIKIATTAYNTAKFSSVVTALNNAVDTIKTVVANTITQATAVANLHSRKQTKPTDTCPAGKTCLLVEDMNGDPHWYEIVESYYNPTLPDGYTELEYIESTGTQYIDTGYFFTDIATETVTIDFMRTGTGAGSLLYGTRKAYKDNGCAIQFQDSGNTYMQYGEIDSGLGSQNKGSLNTRYTLTQTGPTYNFNGGSYTSTGATPTQSYPLYLFTTNNGGSPSAITPMRVYSFVIKDINNSIKLHLVPAKNASGVIGMYDLANNQFYTNAGTGTFTAPNVLPAGYTRLQYIESDGKAYIDTGILLSNTDVFEITFQSLNSLESPIMGAISGGTSYTSTNNLSVTYTVASSLSDYSVYCDGAAGNSNFSWNGGNRADGLKHTIKYNGLNIAPTIDGVAMTQITPATLVANTPTVTTWLFGRNNTSTGTLSQAGVRIYDFHIHNKGHFVPAKNSSGVVGMYNVLDNNPATAFHTNKGSGSFTPGAPVQ